MTDRIPAEVLRRAAELRAHELTVDTTPSTEAPSTEADPVDRIPQALRDRAAARTGGDTPPKKAKRKPAASGARILTAGISVAAGIGLVGAMATSAAASNQPASPAVAPPAQRVIIIEQPAATPVPAPAALPDVPTTNTPLLAAPATTTSAVPATNVPVVRVVEVQPAPEAAPEPVTVSEGS